MVAEVFGNVLGNLFGGFMGQQANAQGVLLSAQEQKKLMDHQAKVNWKYYQKELQNRWQLAREGLEKGNYNPMLALQGINGNSSWTNQASISDTGAGTAFNSGMANAQGVAQLRQQAELNDSTIGLNNSQSFLNQEKANTELYTQLEKANHADLMHAESVLADKNSTYVEKKMAWEQKESAKRIEQMGSQIKLNQQHALLLRSQDALTNTQNLSSAEDVKRKQIENQKLDNYYNPSNRKLKAFRQTLYDTGQGLRDLTQGSRFSVTPRR